MALTYTLVCECTQLTKFPSNAQSGTKHLVLRRNCRLMDTTRTTLAVSVALALATVRGFVLLPCGLDRSHFSARCNGRIHNSTPSCGNPAVGFANPPSASARSSFTRCTSLPRIPCSAPSHSRARSGGDYLTVGRSSSRCCRPIRAGATTMGLTPRLLVPGAGRKLAFAGLVNAAAFATVGGGVLSGGLHAVSGPDHLAALLPRVMGQKWYSSMRIGATWGLGHGFSATIIGLAVRELFSHLSLRLFLLGEGCATATAALFCRRDGCSRWAPYRP